MKFRSATPVSWLRRAPGHRRAWLRLLLAGLLWSSLQGLLGWVVVQSTVQSGQSLVQVCTPNGMQWLAQDDAPGPVPSPSSDTTLGLIQPCVWASAGLSLPPNPQWPVQATPPLPEPLHWAWRDRAPRTPDTVARVLLMAPMRAPPPPLA